MKRIVLEHPDGTMQILGVVEDQPAPLLDIDAGVLVDGVPTAVNLVAAHRSYYLYRAVHSSQTGAATFHKDQR